MIESGSGDAGKAGFATSETGAGTVGKTGAVAENGIAIDETERLIASDKVEGTAVYNREGEHLGAVRNFMVDKLTGQVAYAVMSFGGFFGMGERYFPLPWQTLDYDPALGGYVVDIDRNVIENAPSYAREETPWTDPSYGRNVYGYYGVPYYF